MRMLRNAGRAGWLVAAVLVGVLALAQQAAWAEGEAFLGTWKLNVGKSRYSPGPPPQSQTSVYEAAGQGVKVTTTGTSADGKATSFSFTANYDGKDYAVTGNPDWDQTALKLVNAHTVEFTRKRMGKVVQTGTNVVSEDGKTRTVTSKGTNAKGQAVETVGVYEKQ